MSDSFIGEIRLLPYNFAPYQWASCDGQIMLIQQNTALFSLLGTTYGGDGKSTFGLPNLNGRAVLGAGAGQGLSFHPLGESNGSSSITLLTNEMPNHSHTLQGAAVNSNTSNSVSGNMFAQGGRGALLYAPFSSDTVKNMNAVELQPVGNSLPHENRQPFLVIQYCISLYGIYPSHP